MKNVWCKTTTMATSKEFDILTDAWKHLLKPCPSKSPIFPQLVQYVPIPLTKRSVVKSQATSPDERRLNDLLGVPFFD